MVYFMDLPIIRKIIANKNTIYTIVLHRRAANAINNSTASGPEAVKFEPNVCVVKSKAL